MRYAYDLLGNRIHQRSMEAGDRWTISDVAGNPIRSLGQPRPQLHHHLRRAAPPPAVSTSSARRPTPIPAPATRSTPSGCWSTRSSMASHLPARARPPRTVRNGSTCARASTGTSTPPASPSTRGSTPTAHRSSPTTSRATCWAARAGSPPRYKRDPRLVPEPATSARRRAVRRQHALRRAQPAGSGHRAAQRRGPAGSPPQPQRPPAGLQRGQPARAGRRLAASGAGRTEPKRARPRQQPPSPVGVANIDYDAKGQRTLIDYKTADGRSSGPRTRMTTTRSAHAPVHASRVDASTAGRDFTEDCDDPPVAAPDSTGNAACGLQNLRYTYDPAGNITHIQDDAQPTIFFLNQRVDPSNDYTYDARYRLIQARGREHLGQRPTAPAARRRRPMLQRVPHPPGPSERPPRDGHATSSATSTTPSATSCRCSTAAATRRTPAGRAPTTTSRPA